VDEERERAMAAIVATAEVVGKHSRLALRPAG